MSKNTETALRSLQALDAQFTQMRENIDALTQFVAQMNEKLAPVTATVQSLKAEKKEG